MVFEIKVIEIKNKRTRTGKEYYGATLWKLTAST